MKNKVLGLDLGSASIGWALISEDQEKGSTEIIDLGCRIIPYEGTEGQEFEKGTGESANATRTAYRRARRNFDRYQLRREFLVKILVKHNMMPGEDLIKLPKMDLWELRSRAVTEKITLQELGRLMLLLNQKRGYKSARSDSNLDKKDTEYVATVKGRHETIKELGVTIGQYFYNELKSNEFFRIKENVFPREAYIEEFDAICKTQQGYHSELTDELIKTIRDQVIYYQRELKSQKGLVATCEFEGFQVTKNGKEYFAGPKVAHRSSPLFQVTKIWESINNLRIRTKTGDEIYLTPEERQQLFDYLNENEKLTFKKMCSLFSWDESDLYVDRKLYNTGLQGNITRFVIGKLLKESPDKEQLLKFDLKIVEDSENQTFLFSKKTGEILEGSETNVKHIDKAIEQEPLFRLWHTIYSIPNTQDCVGALVNNFNLDQTTAESLASLDFNKYGYSNKSSKVLRKTLPYLMEGYGYSDAMELAGYSHSGSLTKDENLARLLLDKIPLLPKNSLRQPVVEKILNQMIHLVNAIIEEYGKPDEIRVELARELKQSKEERRETESFIRRRTKENDIISKELEEFGLRATRNNIIKWRLYHEIENEEKKLNAVCIYCGQPISLAEAICGADIDVDHIIPKSRLFDDSQSNKTIVHRHCNSTKGNLTAYDFMKGKSEKEFLTYVERVNSLFQNHLISKTKRDKLLMTAEKIPQDFIERQLRETQYISNKARELLSEICRNVWSTSGTVTSTLRYLWGWDDITMNLQLPRYREVNQTELVSWESNHGKHSHSKEVISGWSKRDDQRHHAIDALTIACTKQGFVQRINTLNSSQTRRELEKEVAGFIPDEKERLTLLEKYLISKQPISVKDVQKAVAGILISFKRGKKVATSGTRKIKVKGKKQVVQKNILVPRGPLSEESVYGKIQVLQKEKPIKYLFENPNTILKDYIKQLVLERLKEHDNNTKKALAYTRKHPIYLDKDKKYVLEYATCLQHEYVIKYPVDTTFNKVEKVIDDKIKELLLTRLEKHNNNPKEAFKDVVKEDNQVLKWYEDEGLPTPIYSVRCSTGLSAVVPVSKNAEGENIGFVKPGNNHHIGIYQDASGNYVEHVCTFWHAVERRQYNIPVIVQDTTLLWGRINSIGLSNFPPSFIENLPPSGLGLKYCLQQNEMFVLGLLEEEVKTLIDAHDYCTLSNYLYRVQKISSLYYVFRHHLETQLLDKKEALQAKRYYRIASLKALLEANPISIKINLLGKPYL